MNGQTFVKRRVAISGNGFQTIHEVNFGGIWRKIERVPSQLSWTDMNFGIQGKEARLEL